MINLQVALLLVASFSPAQPPNPGDELRYVFAGMLQEREKLWSGSYEIEGVDQRWGPIKASVLFKKEKVRFTKTIGEDKKKRVVHACDDGVVIAIWSSEQTDLQLRKSEPSSRSLLCHWDPHAAGFVFMDQETDYRKALSLRLNAWLANSTVMKNNLLRSIVFTRPYEFMDSKLSLTVNCDSGFIPSQYSAISEFKPNSQYPGKVVLEYQANAEWEKKSEVWVPVHHRQINKQNEVTCEYRLKWNWVNQEVEDREFTAEALKPPAGAKTIDFRNVTQDRPEADVTEPILPPSQFNFLGTFGASFAVLVVLAGFWYWLRR